MSMRDPKEDGYQTGAALRALFGDPRAGQTSAAFTLARRFSAMMGYQSADQGIDYIEGFVQGIGAREVSQIAPPTA